MKTAKTLFEILAITMALSAQVQAQFVLTTNNGAITIAQYTGEGGPVTIPSMTNGLPVTSIGGSAFEYAFNVTSVTIPNSVTSIGDHGFYFCPELSSVTIPNSVTSIGDYAFWECSSLSRVTIPDSVTSIGDNAFFECSSLTSMTIPDSVTELGGQVFFGCTSLTNVTIGNSVTSINAVFANCTSLTMITVPNSVTDIGVNAFYNCTSLTSVTIGNSVTSLGWQAFVGCNNLVSLYFSGNAPAAGGEVFLSPNLTIYYLPGTTGWSNPFDGIPAFPWNSVEPVITAQPQPVVVNAYDTASFSVTVSSTVPLNYQWSLNGTNLSGTISSSLTIPEVVQTNLGAYDVLVTNVFGAVFSSNAVLAMYPFIKTQFTGAVTYWGKSATFGIFAWGTEPLYYQWFQNGNAINGATNQTLNLNDIQFTDAGLYSVVVSNFFGSTTNALVPVIVEPAGVSLGFSPTLTISGVVGYNYIIQGSTNLADTNSWVTLTNLTLTQPVQIWVDTNVDTSSPFNPRKFYQVLPGQ